MYVHDATLILISQQSTKKTDQPAHKCSLFLSVALLPLEDVVIRTFQVREL